MSSLKLKHSGGNSVSLNPPTTAPTSSDVAFKLPNADGSASQVIKTDGSGNLAFTTVATVNGITEVDQWGITSTTSSDTDPITTWSRISSTGSASPLGTGMSVSSGVFTFPTTGKYLIYSKAKFSINDSDSVAFNTYVTTNNGTNWSAVTSCTDGLNGSGQNRDGGSSTMYFVDVTDTSQVKVKFTLSSVSSGTSMVGATEFTSGAIFIRLGDT